MPPPGSFSPEFCLMTAEETPVLSRFSLPWVTLLALALWAWAIWSCAEHWLGNPNYSYGWAVPPLALGFALRRYLMTAGIPANSGPAAPISAATGVLGALGLGA